MYEVYTLYVNHIATVSPVFGKTNAKNLAINISRLQGVVDVVDNETGEIVFTYQNGFKVDFAEI